MGSWSQDVVRRCRIISGIRISSINTINA